MDFDLSKEIKAIQKANRKRLHVHAELRNLE